MGGTWLLGNVLLRQQGMGPLAERLSSYGELKRTDMHGYSEPDRPFLRVIATKLNYFFTYMYVVHVCEFILAPKTVKVLSWVST